ncbi:bromodomain adjacent to zinc finger domain protein 2B-like isoform X3 [Stylophora pistillata]|uniref:Bromodomain adjacent to zinc finger domain protein 2A n=1 Tax=Stylophora pistillata TaxID=50429 RepID=A0A2B4SV47_STYPI|nr:bromodomain adjacent to zinc finger domain protein 2B-like isoform X3 [Stylophora pistillata]PFX32428.1 Bromodomain adjacent to zinc finger domain protein 2A [Stylophora pistillata]
MDPRDVPNHSPAHTHSFFDGNPGHANTVLRSPPLPHDPSYGMHPSAFSMMGRRPGLPDFRGSIDPILGSQSSLTSPGGLHGSLSGPGSTGWWLPPHPRSHGITPEYFTGHLGGSWLSHEHECAMANHERLEECLYPSARPRNSLMNGVNSSGVFGSGSGIFYPPPSSPQSMHGFVHQASPTTSVSKSGLSHWSSHGNHDGKSLLDLGESRDIDMIPRLNRKLSNCSEDGNNRDSDVRPSDTTLHHKERTKDTKVERTKTNNSFSENSDARSENVMHSNSSSESNSSHNQRQLDLSLHSEVSNIPSQQSTLSLKSGDTKSLPRVIDENHKPPSVVSVAEASKAISTPPRIQKVKSGPPPRLQVPQSILNKTEGIVPTNTEPQVKAGKDIQALLREEMLKPSKKGTTNSTNAKPKQSKAEIVQNIAVSDLPENKLKAATSEQKPQNTLKGSSVISKPTSGTPPKQPKIPSGKPPLIAHFRDVKDNKDSSDDDSDSSNVSSGSESGSGSEDESDEGEEGENEEDSSGSDTDTDGSDDEEEGGEQHDDDDDDEDDDDVAMDTQESGASFEDASLSHKRKADPSTPGTPRKRRRAVSEEDAKIPLAKGWRRQTRLRQVGTAGGLRGDVYYFAPCGKKLRTYPEVTRYLNKNSITDVTTDNFSFSTKLHIGEFLECKEGSMFEPLAEEEVKRRKQEEDEKNRAKMEKLHKKQEKKQKQAEMAQKAAAVKRLEKNQRQAALEAVKMAKRERAEARMRNKAMKREALLAAREAKKERVRMLAEQKRLAKERAREQRQQARRKKKEDAANAKYEDAMKKAKERELKRQQAVLLKQQEKEQKKQQQMMIRAIESQRKQEERERLNEEKKMEKKLQREKKLEQKRREMILARELKKPVEDMVLKDSKALPELMRVLGLQVPGGAFADLLMVQEFVYNFSDALELDSTEIPSLWEMQSSLLNDSSEDVLVPLCQSLLISALEDPGCEGPDSFTVLGVSLSKVELNETNFSEVLRLFILARNAGDPHPLADALLSTPFQALTTSDKAGVLAYLCNELLCSRNICKEIESSIEHMSNLRRDKWVVEGKIRKLKAIQAEKYPVVKVKKPPGRPRVVADPDAENSNSVADDSMQGNEDEEEEEEEEEEDDEEDDDDDNGEGGGDGAQSSEESEEEDDATEPTTQEELERRLKKLEKKHAQFRSKLFGSSHALRALCLGQDRYKRRYWILPRGGGVFVEGMDTAEKEIVLDIKPEGEEPESMQVEGIKQEPNSEHGKESVVGNHSGGEPGLKSPTNNSLKSPLKSPNVSSSLENISKADTSTGNGAPSGDDKGGLNNVNGSVLGQAVQPKLNNSYIQTAASRNAMEIQRIENLFRDEASTSKPDPSHQKLLNVSQEQDGNRRPWFNLLPRMPCDEASLTLSHSPSSGHFVPTYSKRGGDAEIGSTPPLKRPPGRPPRIANPNYDSTNRLASPESSALLQNVAKQTTTIQFLPQLPVKRPPGRPPKSSYQTVNLVYFDGHPGGDLPTSTLALSTQSASTMSLSFEELKKNVLESLMQEPAPIPPELQHGWWRITDPAQVKEIVKILHSRGIREKILQKNLQKYSEYANSSCTKGDRVESDSDDDDDEKLLTVATSEKNKNFPFEDKTFPEVAFAVDKAILREVEEMEEKVFTASLQVKGWRLPTKASKGLSHNSSSESNSDSEENQSPLAIAIARLLALEQAVERRYLKHPLRNDKLNIPANIGTAAAPGEVPSEDGQPREVEKPDSAEEEILTPALKIWRNAVVTSQSASQLSMCLNMLYDCVAWEKSIMKVFCQICRKGDNEELLLLCDGCDRGYHTYCCMPKLSSIPEGDWYCTDCIVLAAGSDNCCICGGATGKMAKCDNCPRNFHLQCLEPPLSKVPRASWTCPNCKKKRSKPRRRRKIRDDDEEEDDRRPLTPPPKEEVRPHANRKQASKDMAPCRMILAEMEKHEDAWPFLVPVNPKQFPEYYKIIKRPMDFHTMKIKLRDCQYQGPNEFVDDARTVFLNCEEFNEDDSEVGQAGKRLFEFFERRWEQLAPNMD